jgi:hypothetical protein
MVAVRERRKVEMKPGARRIIGTELVLHTGTIVAIVVVCLAGAAHAENSACWGDDSRGDITCVKITQQFLLSLRGQGIEVVRKLMKAPGRELQAHILHFISNYDRGREIGAGTVNVTFEDGRAIIVAASVDSTGDAGQIDFVWNVYAAPPLGEEFDRSTKDFGRQPYCSDFSGRSEKCSGRNIDGELTLSQMEFGLTKAELLQTLETSCNPGRGIVVSDPAGDCARLRDRLREQE